ncbi:MAG: hypothetical protein PXX73_03705 [Sideroxydans sp.]|nr:hypothetical protein [Sideroxydans sp.]
MNALETKLAQLVAMSMQLRAENHQLRQDLAQVRSQQRVMGDNMDNASARLEKILLSLPDDLP